PSRECFAAVTDCPRAQFGRRTQQPQEWRRFSYKHDTGGGQNVKGLFLVAADVSRRTKNRSGRSRKIRRLTAAATGRRKSRFIFLLAFPATCGMIRYVRRSRACSLKVCRPAYAVLRR